MASRCRACGAWTKSTNTKHICLGPRGTVVPQPPTNRGEGSGRGGGNGRSDGGRGGRGAAVGGAAKVGNSRS